MNGMKVLKYSAAVITAVAMFGISSAQAMSVSWAANGMSAITSPHGTAGLPSGDLLELGYTTSSAAAIDAAFTSGGPTAVNALFTVWATDYSTDGTDPSAPGTFSLTTTTGNGTDSALFTKQIYLLAFNATTVAGATEAGVWAGAPFNGQQNLNGDNWTFPASDPAGGPSVSTDDINANGVLLGAFGVGADTDAGDLAFEATDSMNALELAQNIPEPSTITLVVLGMLGAIGMIRRNRR